MKEQDTDIQIKQTANDESLEAKIENLIDFVAAYDALLSDAEREGSQPQSITGFMVDYIKNLKDEP